ncbi:VOC family protein [Arthrobacter sp.]|uniref:VOC family protein n=1 Tax=Arthrobacter sp. TaxID=1667 RepID=UPI002811C7A9|nr:VOC family protein [Arthrobacter sp.]
MTTSVFINLPVKDLPKSKEFYTSLGWSLNPAFSDDNAGCIVISDTIYVMILTHEHYQQFTDKQIADTSNTSAVLNAISVDTPEEIDGLVDRAIGAGAVEGKPQDYGFMRSRTFADPDGHSWEVLWMDPIAQTGDWAAVQEKYPQEA